MYPRAAHLILSTDLFGFPSPGAPSSVVSTVVSDGKALTTIESNVATTVESNALAAVENTAAKVGKKTLDVVEHAAKNNGTTRTGYQGGGNFANDGRGGGQVLLKTDAKGNPVTYKEYDVNPYQKGVNRGTERVVIGNDGKAYYTNDHYKTFTPIQR